MSEKDCILVVDDDEGTRKSLALLLKRKGFEIELAGTGKEALEIAECRPVDLTLLDIKLPDIEGIQLLAPLKKTNPDMAIIMITGFASVESAVQSLTAGASGYITKPIDLDEMLARIKNALDHQHLVTNVRRAEEELKVSLAKYKVLFESFPLAITISDKLGNIVESNRRAEEILEFSPDEQAKRKIDGTEWQLIRSDGTPLPSDEYASVRALKENRMVQDVEMGIVKGNSAVTWINVTAAPIPLKDFGVAIAYSDITERKQAEQELQNSFSFLNSLIDQSSQSMWISDEKGTLIRLNPACCDLMKITAADVVGKYNLFSDNLILEQGFLPMVRDVFLKGQPANFQITYDTQNLKNLELDRCVSVILDVTIFPVKDSSGKVTNAVIQHTNITGRKRAEEEIMALNRDLEKRVEERTGQLNKSLHEKEVLLKEVHHRVKNNLQIVASLLSLQSRYIKDERVLDMLKESQNRVKTMALVHERLYRSEDIAHIDLADYIRFLATNLFNSYNISPRKIRLTIDMKDIGVDINSAIPVGLIINELVSNSLKSAFPGEAKGEIIISGQKSADSIDIQVKDTGIGMPEGLDWKNAESLGLRLVISLVEQLQGTIELEKGPGTVFRLTLHEKT